MTRKTAIDWEALLAESQVPGDDFTWTDGSNYGLDGYHFDQTMGEGVKNRPAQPGATPGGIRDDLYNATMASVGDLPDEMFAQTGPDVGFVDEPVHAVEDGFDLASMLEDTEIPLSKEAREAASLMDLHWLDPTQEQDPERLPKELVGDKLPSNTVAELEEAWGVDRRTDGISLVPNRDREAERYYESIKSPPPALPGVRASDDQFVPAVQRAIRRSHYGESLTDIAQELVDTLGDSDPRLPMVMERIAADHGLAGTVFINANAFPGIKNGKWVEKLKKAARSAAFVLTADDTVATKLGRVKAKSLNWDKVIAFYRPRLEAAGYKLGSGDPKEVLRRAFLTGPAKTEITAGHKPVDVRPADRVSAADAFGRLAAAGRSEVQVIESLEKRAVERKRKAVMVEVRKWAEAGKLSREEALRLVASTADPVDIRRCLATLVTATANHAYDGTGTLVPKDAHLLRQGAIKALAEKEAALEAGERKKFALHLAKQVKAGLLTKDEAQRILALDKPVHELRRVATMAVQTAHQHRKVKLEATEQRDYKGPEFRAAEQRVSAVPDLTVNQKKVIAHAKKTGVDAREFFALLRFASREMNEGMMGNNLTSMLGIRFTPELLKAAKPLLDDLRAAHEGLAGTVYVDASAYASPTGVKGCEEGALKHRTNQVKTVLAMPRCGGCVHAREGMCSLYGKPLIQAPSDVMRDVKATQRKMLSMANASDAEVTGSYFNPGEFSLSSPMDDIDLVEQTSTEKLGEIMFGGLTLGEE